MTGFKRRRRTRMVWRYDPVTLEPIAKDAIETKTMFQWRAPDGTIYRSPSEEVLQSREFALTGRKRLEEEDD